jgi:hypothetical protein
MLTKYLGWIFRGRCFPLHARKYLDQNSSSRQADAAQKTIDLLLKQREEQRRIDISTVGFQLEAAIHMIDDWSERIASETYNELPDVIEIRATNFSSSIANADRIDGIVAGYMGAHYATSFLSTIVGTCTSSSKRER